MTEFFKRAWIILAGLIITAAVISSLFRALTPWAKQYKVEIEQHLSQAFGQPLKIQSMETGWYWFQPVIKLNQISISEGAKEAIHLKKLLIGINIFSSIWHWQIQPGILLIEDLNLRVRQAKGNWQIDGISIPNFNGQLLHLYSANYKSILAWILAQEKIIIKNLSLQIHQENGQIVPLSGLNLNIMAHSGRYQIQGQGRVAQTTKDTEFQLIADLAINPHALNKTKGQVFFSSKHLLPTQWQGLIPESRIQFQEGQGNFQLWAEIAQGQIRKIQAKLLLRHLSFCDKKTNKSQSIQTLKANLALKSTKAGWQLSGDQIYLRLGNRRWPENSFMLRYQKETQSYFVFVKNILLDSILSTSVDWPELLKPIVAANPKGQLHDTQVKFQSSEINSILTRFTDLSWQDKKRGHKVDHLAGVLSWQPQEGRLELASEHSILHLKKQKPIKLTVLDGALNWKKTSEGFNLNIERLVINHPNLLLSARGDIDQISEKSLGQANLTAMFSAANAELLLPYLPSNFLKPRLDAWLKRDVKRIKELNGDLVLNGPLSDFPFDKQAGTFSVNSHLKGIDLFFAPDFPLTKDLEGFLRVNKRNLEADLKHANLQNIRVDNINLRVDDIGLDREVLLLRTEIVANADKLLNYILNSPLKKKLATLALLKIQGLLHLNLQIEAPLYSENNKVLVLGDLQFQSNPVCLHHNMVQINLNKLTGNLQFNESGINHSSLKADLFHCPSYLAIKSIRHPIPYTEVQIKSRATVENLSKHWNHPIFSLLQGSSWIQSTLKFTEDPDDLDHLSIQTSLDGLHIQLPPPLGKTAATKTPLTMEIDFNPLKALRLRLNYDNRLSSDLWFSRLNHFELQSGQIRLGPGNAQLQDKNGGLQIVGSLSSFELQQWLDLKSKLFQFNGNSILTEALNRINLKLNEIKIWKEHYKDLVIKAKKIKKDDWSIQLKQTLVDANLRYQPTTNTLKGQFDKLFLEDKESKIEKNQTSSLKPSDIPNLDLRIASLQLGKLNLGDVSLKTKSFAKLWRLDSCEIKSPSYYLKAKGLWKQEGQSNSTQLKADLQIQDLASSLKRWNVNPTVEARQGALSFQGGWAGSLADFQLKNLDGDLKIDLKEGRITHLGQEAEEKIGLGKLLSILSLQTIPRRLKFDFSDLSKTGYSFDKFEGNFNISKGIMNTQDSHIDGPVAYASMKGNLDIAKQHYNMDLKVTPHLTSSLPIVATIAGGPVVGFAALVASKIINQGMQNISGYTYKVTGPWQEPVVKQQSLINKRKIPLRG